MAGCTYCGKSMEQIRPKTPDRKFCSRSCRRASYIDLYKKKNPKSGIPGNTVGAINELIVCVDLMGKGYAVFRSMSPACSCDIAILKNERLLRVEVTTGKRSPNGKIMYPPHKNGFDVLAIVLRDEPIVYIPEVLE